MIKDEERQGPHAEGLVPHLISVRAALPERCRPRPDSRKSLLPVLPSPSLTPSRVCGTPRRVWPRRPAWRWCPPSRSPPRSPILDALKRGVPHVDGPGIGRAVAHEPTHDQVLVDDRHRGAEAEHDQHEGDRKQPPKGDGPEHLPLVGAVDSGGVKEIPRDRGQPGQDRTSCGSRVPTTIPSRTVKE